MSKSDKPDSSKNLDFHRQMDAAMGRVPDEMPGLNQVPKRTAKMMRDSNAESILESRRAAGQKNDSKGRGIDLEFNQMMQAKAIERRAPESARDVLDAMKIIKKKKP